MQAATYNHYLLKKESAMADPELPTEFDVIVIGTGLEESIVAAAAARNGHSVLHLDPQNHYGAQWASFSMEGLQTWIKSQSEPEKEIEELEVKLEENEKLIKLKSLKGQFMNLEQNWNVKDNNDADEGDEDNTQTDEAVEDNTKNEDKWTKDKMMSMSRHFNLDLIPRLLYSRGSMVELLISSNISRYTEFKAVSRVLAKLPDGRLEDVPSSRSDVFATKAVSVVEKRILIKFLTFCLNFQDEPERYSDFDSKPYKEFLQKEKLTANLINYVAGSIAMVDENTVTTLVGLKATQKFLSSLGRFGNTPFLWPMYGAGELPQAFCRLSAVFGGTYFLGRPVQGLVTEEGQIKAVLSEGKRLTVSKALVLGAALAPEELLKDLKVTETILDRQISLRSDSIKPAQKEQLSFVSLTSEDDLKSRVFYQEVGNGAAACPREMYCLQATRSLNDLGEAKDDLNSLLLSPEDDKTLWSLRYQMRSTSVENEGQGKVKICSDPRFELDYDLAIENAKKIFDSIFPGEEFLPRAPEPEEIVLQGSEDAEGQNEGHDETNEGQNEDKGQIEENEASESVVNEPSEEIPESTNDEATKTPKDSGDRHE